MDFYCNHIVFPLRLPEADYEGRLFWGSSGPIKKKKDPYHCTKQTLWNVSLNDSHLHLSVLELYF